MRGPTIMVRGRGVLCETSTMNDRKRRAARPCECHLSIYTMLNSRGAWTKVELWLMSPPSYRSRSRRMF